MKLTNQSDKAILDKLEEVEEKIDIALKRIDTLNEKLSKHIDFIDKTYDGLRSPIDAAKRFLGR
tara:strand:- start:817 stop:1008 length:192 start_codon:yes stop_codon:yes gene_type:complete